MSTAQREISRLLAAVNDGRPGAMDALIEASYDDLRTTARRLLRREAPPGRPGATFQTTALVNEAFLKIVKNGLKFEQRGHFFAAFATCMREVLIDYIRGRKARKRGSSWVRVPLEPDVVSTSSTDLVEFEDALTRLEQLDPRKAKVAELRLLCNLDFAEIAEALGLSLATIERDWRFVRAWMQREFSGR
jgi:RNA polymerase sigma factor (TIGR02999 family)